MEKLSIVKIKTLKRVKFEILENIKNLRESVYVVFRNYLKVVNACWTLQ